MEPKGGYSNGQTAADPGGLAVALRSCLSLLQAPACTWGISPQTEAGQPASAPRCFTQPPGPCRLTSQSCEHALTLTVVDFDF